MTQFSGGDVNAVLNLVVDLSEDGPTQLSILTYALSVACKSCGIPKETALQALEDALDDDRTIIPLDSAAARAST